MASVSCLEKLARPIFLKIVDSASSWRVPKKYQCLQNIFSLPSSNQTGKSKFLLLEDYIHENQLLICRKVEYLNFRCKATIRHQAAPLDDVISKICKNGRTNLQILPILHLTSQSWLSLSGTRLKLKQCNEDNSLWHICTHLPAPIPHRVQCVRTLKTRLSWYLWPNNNLHEHHGKWHRIFEYAAQSLLWIKRQRQGGLRSLYPL